MRDPEDITRARIAHLLEDHADAISDPHRIRIDGFVSFMDQVGRNPNHHVGFGFGAHFCLGTHLARMEAQALYNELLPRLQWIELAGQPAYVETLFVGGPKHLPIRYTLT